MTSRNDDEDYWNSSDKKVVTSFDEDESAGVFGISRQGTTQLSQQLRDWELDNNTELNSFTGKKSTDPILPLHDLIAQASLNLILEDCNDMMEYTTSASPQELINKLVAGLPASLEKCKSLNDKRTLVALAAHSGDGETILTVALFVTGTLSEKCSLHLLRDNPTVLAHYYNYLTAKNEIKKLCHIYEALGHFRSTAMLNYSKLSLKALQMEQMKSLAKSYFNGDKDEKYINQQIKLLEFLQTHNLPADLPAQQTIFHASNISTDTLRTLAHSLGMTERVFQWTSLKAKSDMKAWNEIQAIFHAKSWLGSQKFNPLIPMNKVALQLHKAKAPAAEIYKYVQLVDDIHERQKLEVTLSSLSLST